MSWQILADFLLVFGRFTKFETVTLICIYFTDQEPKDDLFLGYGVFIPKQFPKFAHKYVISTIDKSITLLWKTSVRGNMLYDDFKPIVDLVFNNWTALQLAVEHGMGAPGGEKTAQLMSVYVARYCVENVADRDDLTEVLEDLMDEEFETVCHDNSPKEVASLLIFYLGLLKEGRHEELRNHIEAMPKCQRWLSEPIHESVPPQCHGNPDDDTTSSSGEEQSDSEDVEEANANGEAAASPKENNEPEPMDEDVEPGWTVVRTRRRK